LTTLDSNPVKNLTFVDLFAGLGGFHCALSALGAECVMACEIDSELRDIYLLNFPEMAGRVFSDIRNCKDKVPPHDILCAGFPCQPFSKSGSQLGTKDETRGTLFHEVIEILELRRPEYVILENVGNFGRHDGGRTWKIVKRNLERLGYDVSGTEHSTPPRSSDWRDLGMPTDERRFTDNLPELSGKKGYGLLSPHHFGHPHHRERFFVIATLGGLHSDPFPTRKQTPTSLLSIEQRDSELSVLDQRESKLTAQQIQCIDLWGSFVKRLPATEQFPSAPIWADEFRLSYPYQPYTPFWTDLAILRKSLGHSKKSVSRDELLLLLPAYAREEVAEFRSWKIRFIERNRTWWKRVKKYQAPGWLEEIEQLPPSLRKLEWNVQDGVRDIWQHVLQFRPSGLRVKRYSSIPALVAMTTSQIPILGPKRRFLTRVEGLRLQGFPDTHRLPASRTAAFKALGNGVHVGIVTAVAARLLGVGAFIESIQSSTKEEHEYA
jgi:DNA (cytosine-5)-methyltransferase 1